MPTASWGTTITSWSRHRTRTFQEHETPQSAFEARNQIFLGFQAFVGEVCKNILDRDLIQNIPREQVLADRPDPEELFNGKDLGSRKSRNLKIQAAFEKHQYTLKEIGSHLELHPDYLSRLLGHMRKR